MRGEIRRLTRSGDSRVICPVTVQRVEALTPHFSRVTMQGDGLAAYRTIRPADAFKLMIPPDGVGSVRMPKMSPDGLPVWPQDRPMPLMRAFTVRTFDPTTRRLTFDVAVHGAGPAMTWLERTRPGDTVVLLGIRREFHAGDGVDHHLPPRWRRRFALSAGLPAACRRGWPRRPPRKASTSPTPQFSKAWSSPKVIAC